MSGQAQEYRIIASGYRSTIALLSFSPYKGSIDVVSESQAPPSASWIEFDPHGQAGEGKKGLYTISRPNRDPGSQVVYTISEDEEKGLGVSAVLKGDKIELTGQRGTKGAPAHCEYHIGLWPFLCGCTCAYQLWLNELTGSARLAGRLRHTDCQCRPSFQPDTILGVLVILPLLHADLQYMGGNIIFLPTDASGAILPSTSSPSSIEHVFDWPYSDDSAPNKERQDASHPHQAIQASNGDIYVCDLGSDRIWVVSKSESSITVKGWLQAPPGAGPRHAVFSADEKHLYVLTELSSEVLIYDLSGSDYPKHPNPSFKASVIPPNIPSTHSSKMDSAELLIHPSRPRTLYASNRLELHIAENEPDLEPLPKSATEGIKGDAVAIFLLSEDGLKVDEAKHIRTEADGIRGMQMSTDGKYVALAGQQKGGVEIWEISGVKGENWKRVAKNEGVEGVTDLKWF